MSLKQELWDYILNELPRSRVDTSSNEQIVTRCIFCGDSKKDPNKTRLGFKFNMNDDNAPIVYNCFNCGAHGVLTPSTLRDIGVYDTDLITGLAKLNKEANKQNRRYLKSKKKYINDAIIPTPRNTIDNKKKLLYVCERMGVRFTVAELLSYRVIFNLTDFLKVNKLDIGIDERKLKFIDRDYIGFLSSDKSRIQFRDVTGENKIKHNKITLLDKLDDSEKFYAIPGSIDAVTRKPVKINLAEGAFDILGVYKHILNENTDNNFYAAILDASYYSTIEYFLSNGLIGNNVEINIFSDKDKSPYYYTELNQKYSNWVKKINLYYNDLDKDFGVTKDKIYLLKKDIPHKKTY